MAVAIASTQVAVTDVEKVRDILRSFEFEGFFIRFDEKDATGMLQLVPDEYNDEDPLQAVKYELLPDRDDYPDDDSFFDAEMDVYDEKGEEGFLALLLELAPYLESPLLIVWASFSGHLHAQAWNVQPGGSKVETVSDYS